MDSWNNVWKQVPQDIKDLCKKIESSQIFSHECREKIAGRISPSLRKAKGQVALVFVGSLGRGEANKTSDVDAFLLFPDLKSATENREFSESLFKELDSVIKDSSIGLHMASPDGAFANACNVDDLVRNIGGNNEDNKTLTRRQLLLTESRAICADSFYSDVKKSILNKYLADIQPIKDSRPIFLINDLIRYYRTICVDYEYKKNEGGKPWAVRLTKLRHSRKLLYFSSLLCLIESIKIDNKKRLMWLEEQFIDHTPLERIILMLAKYGKSTHWKLLEDYNTFLEFMASPEMRSELDTTIFERRDENTTYIKMRNNAQAFRRRFNDFILSVEDWRDPIAKYVLS
jgi:predicted nucleotidyltransferase